MNKFTKLLSVFIIAGAIGAGVAGAATLTGCKKTPATPPKEEQGDQLEVNKDVTGLIVEGVGDTEVQLSTTKTSHSINKSGIKVYFAKGTEKAGEVPADNVTVKLYAPDASEATSWEGLKVNGEYVVEAQLKNCKWAEGGQGNVNAIKASVTVKVKNAYVSLEKVSGTTTFTQGADVSNVDWTFKLVRANGDKEDAAKADIKVELDSLYPGDNLKAIVKYKDELSLEVSYTVTAVQGMVIQSYAVNANGLTSGKIESETALNGAGKIYATAKSGKHITIDGNSKTLGDKSFTQRIKLEGSPIKDGHLDANKDVADYFRTIKIEDVNKTTTAGATSITRVTVYAMSSSGTADRKLAIYKEGKQKVVDTPAIPGDPNANPPTEDVPATYKDVNDLIKVEAASASPTDVAKVEHTFNGTELQKHVFEITGTGNFHIASTSGGINIYYLQVDKILTNETGAENVPLGGEDKPISLKLNTETAKLVYKQTTEAATVDTSAITGEVTIANDVTAVSKKQTAANADLQFDTSAVDFTKLGKYKVKVSYGEEGAKVEATYEVTVESAVDGVWGAEAAIDSTLVTTVENDTDRVTLKPEHVKVTLNGSNANAVTSVVVKHNGTAIDATTGKEFGIGSYELSVEITVTVTPAEGEPIVATFTDTLTLKVSKQRAPGEVTETIVTMGTTAVSTTDLGANDKTYNLTLSEADNAIASAVVHGGDKCEIRMGQGTATVGGTGYTHSFKTNGTSAASSTGTAIIRRYIDITLTQAGKYKVTVYSKGSANDRNALVFKGTELTETSFSTATVLTRTGIGVESAETTVDCANGEHIYIAANNNIDIFAIVITPITE